MNEWNVPNGWRITALREVVDVVSGGTPARDNIEFWENGTIPWATPTDITANGSRILTSTADCITFKGLNSSSARLLPPGTLLMTSRATLGEAKIAGTEVCTNQGFKNLVPGPDIDCWYLYYQMRQNKERYSIFAIGSTFLEVNKKDTEAFTIPLAPLPQQQKIARILMTLDELIEKTEALIAKHHAIKQGLMQDLFTRGVDEEHGHLRPTYEDAPELYKESEVGWIPKEWACKELVEVVPRAEYGISISMDSDPSGVPVLRMNNLSDGRFDLADLKFSSSCQAASLQLRSGDVLFNRTNSFEHVGRTSMWRGELPECSFASYLVRLHPDLEQITPLFLTLWLNLPATQIAIRQFATPGVHQVNINPTNLRRVRIAVPRSTTEQSAITDKIERAEDRINQERRHLDKLRLQKEGLMQDLLTGEVEVTVDDEEVAHA